MIMLCQLGYAAQETAFDGRQKLASANIGFAFKLLRQIVHDQPGTNVFISAYGASTVLQMVCNGAAGQTKAEMDRVLGTTGMPQDTLNAAAREFDKSINGRGSNVVLATANALWYRKGLSLKPEFLACNQQFFGATVEALDFKDSHSIAVMNAWASEKTHGRITSVANGLMNPLTELFLANAVYFKGKWEEPFEVGNTKDRVFHLRGSRQRKVLMMEQSRTFVYRRGTGYQAVRLPYQGGSLCMYVFLPDAGSGPEKLLGILTGDKWERVTQPGFREQPGTVVLPRFKIEYGIELEHSLKALGMKTVFGPADLSGISIPSPFVSAVRQRAFVDVNEEGTEAAAVTMLMVEAAGMEMNPPKPFEMIVDRPFLFLIEDKETRTILFMGAVFDPGASS